MALAFDAASSTVGAGNGPITWSHTNAGDLIVAGVSWYRTASAVTAFTFDGVAMTQISGGLIQDGDYSVQLFYLIAPATGTKTFSISFGVAGTFDCGIGAISFSGAHQSSPFGTVATGSGTSTTPSINVSSAAGEIVFDTTTITHSGTYTVGAGQTQRWNAPGGNGLVKTSGSTEGGAGTTTMSWSNTTSQFWVMAGVSVKPAGAASFQAAWARGSNVLIGMN